MDVTKEIQKNHIVYGASDYTAPSGLSASKSLNYAKGPTIIHPDRALVTVIPSALRYTDTVGLFGAENYFLLVDLNITSEVAKACYEEPFWQCANIDYFRLEKDNGWISADIPQVDDPRRNTYDPANIIQNKLPILDKGYISIDLTNMKTNNRFIDDWLDIRLYTEDRQEHPYDKMYVPLKSFFYIGVHARNTKRLPYDIMCAIGQEYRSYDSIEDERYIMRRIR